MSNSDALVCGIDIGSTTSKAAIMTGDGKLVASMLRDTQHDRKVSAVSIIEDVCESAGIARSDIDFVGATGYGRRAYEEADTVVPEVLCHGRGTEFLRPGTHTIIDVGGQDSKAIEVVDGIVTRFEMNDKCAAGTGRFFEVLSNRLFKCDISELGPMAEKSTNPVMLSSMCTVFVESEIVSYLSTGVSKEDIARGVLVAQAKRIRGMAAAARIDLKEPVVLSGGIARNSAAPEVFGEVFGVPVEALEQPQLTGAIGVALMTIEENLE